MDVLFSPEAWAALLTLTALEVVLGIDNVIFIAILAAKLPPARQAAARRWGIALALFSRLVLLFSITWVMGLSAPLFALWEHDVSGRDLILLMGGLFLIGKATFEIHDKLEAEPHVPGTHAVAGATFGLVLLQIVILDVVFSLDSVITAVGMARQLSIMVTAVVIAVGIMLLASGGISAFVERHPTFKMLALAFLLLIGVMLVAEGMGVHISKGYIYFAMAFSLFVEVLNLRYRRVTAPVRLHAPHEAN
jgi:predicted tellurium resistance membrane protein TerC